MAETTLAEVVRQMDLSAGACADRGRNSLDPRTMRSEEELREGLSRALRMLGDLTERFEALQRSQRVLVEQVRRVGR